MSAGSVGAIELHTVLEVGEDGSVREFGTWLDNPTRAREAARNVGGILTSRRVTVVADYRQP